MKELKTEYLNMRMTEDLKTRLAKVAATNTRTLQDQATHYIKIGVEANEKVN